MQGFWLVHAEWQFPAVSKLILAFQVPTWCYSVAFQVFRFLLWIKQRGFNGRGMTAFTICPQSKATHTPPGEVMNFTAMHLKGWEVHYTTAATLKPKSGRLKKQTPSSISGTSMCSVHTHTHTLTQNKSVGEQGLRYIMFFAEPVRQNHSGRNVHFAPEELDFNSSRADCWTSEDLLSPDNWTHFVTSGSATCALWQVKKRKGSQSTGYFTSTAVCLFIHLFNFNLICNVKHIFYCIFFCTNTKWLKTFAMQALSITQQFLI